MSVDRHGGIQAGHGPKAHLEQHSAQADGLSDPPRPAGAAVCVCVCVREREREIGEGRKDSSDDP